MLPACGFHNEEEMKKAINLCAHRIQLNTPFRLITEEQVDAAETMWPL